VASLSEELGEYLREQRQNAKLTLRQLAEAADVSNPYLSQIERGLKKPSAEILQSLAKGLRISAESLYVRAGILDERDEHQESVESAINADPVCPSANGASCSTSTSRSAPRTLALQRHSSGRRTCCACGCGGSPPRARKRAAADSTTTTEPRSTL
jgi:transcriptional regulator with XRE-family HTH domain